MKPLSSTMKYTTLYKALGLAAIGIFCFIFFRYAYPYHLIHREQMLLFTYTTEQLSDYLAQPAPLSCLTGDFLTQYFLHAGIGAAIVSVMLMLLGALVFLTVRKWTGSRIAIIIAAAISVWEGLRFCNINYPLSGSISLIGAFVLFLLVDTQKGKWKAIVLNAIGTIMCYLLFGYGMSVFILLTLITSIVRRKNLAINCAVAIIALFIPAIAANRYFTTVAQAYAYPSTAWYGFPDRENERLLELTTELYSGNYEKVIQSAYSGTPDNITSVCYNLANAMQGQLPDKLMNYYQPAALGLFIPIDEESTYLSTQLAGEVWYQLGDMTMAEHAAILGMIFTPQNRSVRMVKRLAEINLINGDKEATQKYLRILSKTQYYKQWAAERIPGNESEEVKTWLKKKQALLPEQDTLRLTSTDIAQSLHLLLRANPDNAIARDYLLCFDLLQKDITSFVNDYKLYHTGAPNRLYSEALMIHLYQKHASGEETKSSGIHPAVIKDFNDYNRQYTHSHGNPADLEIRFGQTYWFYYQFAQFQ